jgi:arsenate reductase (glutaredoxin)
MAITLYGIPHCDTVKKARGWLAEQGLAYTFHDVKKQGITPVLIDEWLRDIAWDNLLNRNGTTYRQLPDAQRAAIVDAASARDVMVAHPSAIKRPVVHWADGALTVGFDEAVFTARMKGMSGRRASRG